MTGMNLARVEYDREDYAAGEVKYARAAELFATHYPDHFASGIARMMRGRCLARLERFEDAERALLAAHTRLADALGGDNGYTREAAKNLAELYERTANAGEASRWRSLAGQARVSD